jgi:hypothetical protein
MGIIITNPDLEYGRLGVKILFSHALNLRGVGFNSHTFQVGVEFSLWLYSRMVRDEHARAQCGVGRCYVPNPTWGWARTHPWPIVGLCADACHDPMWSWVGHQNRHSLILDCDFVRWTCKWGWFIETMTY